MINEHLKKENTFLDDWAAKVSGFIRDEIVDHEFYWKSGIKILFLLKEVNGGEDWDLREFLREGGRKQTWDNVTRWVIGICLLYTSPSPRDRTRSRMPSSA